jgi:DNA-binding response OmpR family regulator
VATPPGRVVFITGDTQSESARSVLEATGCAIVSKPFLLDELAAVVLAEAEH